MEMSRRSFLARAAALAALGGFELSPEAASGASAHRTGSGAAVTLAPKTLHGYGTISAAFRVLDGGRASLTHITCESGPKALLTQAKYLSDLERLPGVEKGSFAHRGQAIPLHHSPSGVLACYARGREVLILAAADASALARLCAAVLPATAAPGDFTPRVPVPMFLDRWDRYGLLCYFAPEAPPPGAGDNGPLRLRRAAEVRAGQRADGAGRLDQPPGGRLRGRADQRAVLALGAGERPEAWASPCTSTRSSRRPRSGSPTATASRPC